MNDITAIFAFLKYCLGSKEDMSMVIAGMDWQELYSFASKQALLGLCLEGIERLGKEYPEELKQNPIGRELVMNWMGKAQQIRRQNMKVNAVAGKLFSMLREDGMRCCVLKGQGNALMYPNPYSRTPGDIDVWVNASRERIMEYAQKKFELEDDIRLQHLETSLDGVPVELHFFPCSMNNPLYNARLQKCFKRNADLQCSNVVGLPNGAGDIAIPTTAFNVVYQLTHLYHHFFDEGIGMRQIIDYFLVVNNFSKNVFLDTDFSNQPVNFSNHPVPLSKEGSTFSPSPSSSGSGDVTAPSRCSEPLRSKDGGASKPSPDCAGWDRRGVSGDTSSASCSSASGSSITSVRSAAVGRDSGWW
ncbi:nucleotidyltransferase family protein [Prevotella sp.]